MIKKQAVIGVGPDNFAGAGMSHAGTLKLLAKVGTRTYYIGFKRAYRQTEMEKSGIRCRYPKTNRVDAYPGSDIIRAMEVAEEVTLLSKKLANQGYDVTILSTYLFPFCQAALFAVEQLQGNGVRFSFVVIPAGSDVWQVGDSLPNSAKRILDNQLVTKLVTYSKQFAGEIKDRLKIKRLFDVVPPIIDVNRFRPISTDMRYQLKTKIGIPNDEKVLVHVSNMRPIKELGLVLELAKSIAHAMIDPVWLVLVGPTTDHLYSRLKQCGVDDNCIASRKFNINELNVLLAGLCYHTERFLQISDLFLNTSLHDSFNISLAESLACGLPVISSDVVGITEISDVLDSGHFFPIRRLNLRKLADDNALFRIDDVIESSDFESAVHWAVSVINNEVKWNRISEYARNSVVENLSEKPIREKWVSILRGV